MIFLKMVNNKGNFNVIAVVILIIFFTVVIGRIVGLW